MGVCACTEMKKRRANSMVIVFSVFNACNLFYFLFSKIFVETIKEPKAPKGLTSFGELK
jgi:hypothetical protein